ncbi:hypothetical protein TNCV_4565191 [Trichonephila clavipes]|nr:hypothetical protein TNCV_4565191 [Trichonephila clavipes]
MQFATQKYNSTHPFEVLSLLSEIVRVQYFERGGFVRHRSRASSKHLSPHLPVDELDSSGVKKGLRCSFPYLALALKSSWAWDHTGSTKQLRKTCRSSLNPPTGQHGFFRPTREASKTDHTEFFVRPGTHPKNESN